MKKVEISESEYQKMQRQIEKLEALEKGGVDNWEWYGESLKEWFKENELDELLDDAIENINDILIDAKVEEPAGRGCGYSITFDEISMKEYLRSFAEKYLSIDKENS